MLTLDAVNEMIGYVGESPLDSTDSDYTSHPLYESALRILTSTSKAVQSKGWWFNTRTVTLTPSAGAVAIPDSYLSVAILQRGYAHDYTVRNGALYDLTDDTATIAQALQAAVRELVLFDDLPETAAQYIAAEAAVRFVKTYDGDRSKLADAKDTAQQMFAVFHQDHIRNSKVNLFSTASVGPILANNWYSRYRVR